ncbi:MAG TPA: DJ-1/PfpI family protein, partial [Chitinophagaceae bacterium]|nr:DJ-1/PfpI family protein [Chitinophagaceae bacterium]
MKHVSILALKNSSIASLADARTVFLKVNELLAESRQKRIFDIQVVGMEDQTGLDDNLFLVQAEALSEQVKKTDLIIVPSLTGDMMTATHNNRFFVDWIVKQYKRNAEIASLSTGAFMLAFSGLLKNKKCTTHWQYANEFR